MSDNEFDLDLGINLDNPPPVEPTKKKVTKKAPKKQTVPVDQVEDLKVSDGKKEVSMPAKEELVKIIIDEVPGMSNYEVVGVNGTLYQIKRGVPVEVPMGVVYALQDAVMTQVEVRRNPLTGEREEIVRHHSAIPWRRA